MLNDNEENYRAHLAELISKTKSRGHSRYFNQYVAKCKEKAAQAYPTGAAAARKRDMGHTGIWGPLFATLEAIFG